MATVDVVGLDHVAIGVPDVEVFVRRLTETFGMEVARRGSHHETGRPIAFLQDAKGSKVELIEADVDTPTFLHLAFAVPEAGAAYETLVSSEFSSVAPPVRLEAAKAETAFTESPEGLEAQVIAFD